MRKVLLQLVIFSLTSIFSEEVLVTKMKMETLLEIPIGRKNFNLGEVYEPEGMSTTLLMDMIVLEDSYIIQDIGNQRVVMLNKDLTSFTTFKTFTDTQNRNAAPSSFISIDNNNILASDYNGKYSDVFNYETDSIVLQLKDTIPYNKFFDDNRIPGYGLILIDNLLIGEIKEKSFFVIDLLSKKETRILIGGEAINLLKSKYEIINIKEDLYLVQNNNKILTRSPLKFYNFMFNKKNNIPSNMEKLKKSRFKDEAYFSGMDIDGNYYWSRGSGCYIFNSKGSLIKHVSSPRASNGHSDMLRYAVDKQGNLYKLFLSDNKYLLKWIKRTW
ncbi:MAG: hypothetical protein OCD02_16900 [Spirochaetaceae bacterium]